MALRGNGKKWEEKEIRQKGRKFINKKLTLYKETKQNYNDKEKTKQKGRKEKETAYAWNQTQDLVCTKPFCYHHVTWKHTIKDMIIFYLEPFP